MHSSLCSNVPSLREATLPERAPPAPHCSFVFIPKAQHTRPYASLFILGRLLLQGVRQLPGSGALQGRFLLPGGRAGDAQVVPQASLSWIVLSWGALRGKGKGDVEGVNGGEVGSYRCGQTERPREARTELRVWGDPQGPRETEIPTERKRQNSRCSKRPRGPCPERRRNRLWCRPTWRRLEETLRAGRQAPARPGKGCNCLFSHGAERSSVSPSLCLESQCQPSAMPPDTQTQKIQMHLGLACFQVRICPWEKMSLMGRKTELTSPWGPITHSSLGRSWQVAPGCCRRRQRDGPQRFLPGLPLKDTARGRLVPLKGKSCVMF